jgi:hypothetical protein
MYRTCATQKYIINFDTVKLWKPINMGTEMRFTKLTGNMRLDLANLGNRRYRGNVMNDITIPNASPLMILGDKMNE